MFEGTESKMLQTTIDKFFEEKNKGHHQPPQNPRMGREVVDEGHRYLASPAGQQDQAVFQLRSRSRL
jgi:hypothetical protein